MISNRVARTVAMLGALAWSGSSPGSAADGSKPISFDREIRPILAENCFSCHGPDASKRKAKLRLDLREGAVADLGDGRRAIVPGKPGESGLVERVEAEDPEERMPPPSAGNHKALTAGQVATLRRWIESGAEYTRHWAYERPRVEGEGSIDRYVEESLKARGIAPAEPADRATLIRRLGFDLLGLPPSPGEVDAFEADPSPDAYEKLVDRLLASPHFGERMAMAWLDGVRYADTTGYHSDNHREVSPYRDYVIRSFNDNTPFDRFTVEQLAGDLLPDPSSDALIASGYNRMGMTTQEGGAQAGEYVAKYAADRVRNASAVWLGATLGCAECHDHKFDPYTQRDFYRFAAFFADVTEVPIGEQPLSPVPSRETRARLAAIDAESAPLRARLDGMTPLPDLGTAQSKWEEATRADLGRWIPLVPTSARADSGAPLTIGPDGTISAGGAVAPIDLYTLECTIENRAITAVRVEAIADDSLPSRGPGRAGNGNFVLSELAVSVGGQPVALGEPSATFEQAQQGVAGAIDGDPKTGWAIMGEIGRDHDAVFETKHTLGADRPLPIVIRVVQAHGAGHLLGRFRIAVTEAPRPVRATGPGVIDPSIRSSLAVEPSRRTAAQAETLAAAFRAVAPEFAADRTALAALDLERKGLIDATPMALITTAGPPRTTRVLARGDWRDTTGAEVTPAVPGFLGAEVAGRRANRLDLARWIVDPTNPLTARVFVNRVWALAFGQGLVASVEDFGAQGEVPSHPELLDRLASEFVAEGWDVKRLVRRIVTSEAYRRSSRGDSATVEADPANRLLARQSRFRLDAELVRDDMLAISGLLADRVGGPSVKPYQPAGYWAHLNFPKREYQADHGEGLHRRAIYTYWMRSFLHPSLLAFDAPSREECAARRSRSNTPTQALVLLNDPIFVEGARAFAGRILREGGADDTARVDFAVRCALGRRPGAEERAILVGLVDRHRAHYRAAPAEATALLKVGELPIPAGSAGDPAELAAWTSVARAILNLHETITRD